MALLKSMDAYLFQQNRVMHLIYTGILKSFADWLSVLKLSFSKSCIDKGLAVKAHIISIHSRIWEFELAV